MRLLLDTHILLWAAEDHPRLSAEARRRLSDRHTTLMFSVVSLWEIQVKSALGRPDFRVDAHQIRRGLMANGYEELTVTAEHVLDLEHLPPLHRDPFDRMLLCQARVEGTALLTVDEAVASYGPPAVLVA